MTIDSDTLNRRTALKVLGAGGVVALAGCVGSDDDDDGTTGANGDDDPNGDDDANGDDTDEVTQSLDEGPAGSSLSDGDILALLEAFDDQPFSDCQREQAGELRDYTPSHAWKWVTDETMIGLHFNEPNPEDATGLLYVVIGTKGLFTEESKPGEEFTHFHQHTADSWEAGHGGSEGDEGYWLTHIAADEFELPFHEQPTTRSVDYNFFPTEPPAGSTGHTTDFETPGDAEGALSGDEVDALLDAFDDDWANESQREIEGERKDYTPSHAWKWIGEDEVMFLHFNEPNPDDATGLLYFGKGVRGQFTEADRPDGPPSGDGEDYTHFHLHEADSWEAGHGGSSPDQWGFWLVHHAVDSFELPFHEEPTEVGVDRAFFPTNPE